MLLMLLWSMLMQAAPETAPSLPAQRAQAWLTTVYPALRHGDVAVDVYGDSVTTRVVVTAQAAKRIPGDATSAPVLLVADLHRSKATGRLEAMQARGPLVRSDKLAALAAAVAAHPGWTATDVAVAITNAGGRFPPGSRAALLAQLPPLTDVFGGAATFDQAAFVNTDARGPVWLVDATVGPRSFRLAVEPFEGQVIGLAAR
jgi:hypothetical protein